MLSDILGVANTGIGVESLGLVELRFMAGLVEDSNEEDWDFCI